MDNQITMIRLVEGLLAHARTGLCTLNVPCRLLRVSGVESRGASLALAPPPRVCVEKCP